MKAWVSRASSDGQLSVNGNNQKVMFICIDQKTGVINKEMSCTRLPPNCAVLCILVMFYLI